MSDAAKWLRELSEPWASGEKVKTAIDRAAKLSGLSYWRASDIWYDKARKIESYEIDQIADALKEKNERDARHELQELKARITRMESRLLSGDAEFYSPSIDHAREMASQLRGMGRAVVRRG